MRYLRRPFAGALALLLVWSCDGGQLTQSGADRIEPTVSVSMVVRKGAAGAPDTVDISKPVSITVTAADEAALQSVTTRVFIGTALAAGDSTTAIGTPAYKKTFTAPLTGAIPGQLVRVQSVAVDGGGNQSTHEAVAVAFDPNVPTVRIANPEPTVIPGGTYVFTVSVSDSLGISKIGYRVSGAGFTAADSVLRATQGKADSAIFSVQLPAGIAVGSAFSVEPFAENRTGRRGVGAAASVRVVSAGADVLSPLVFQTVPARLEHGDPIDLSARDPDGLVRVVGFIAKDSSGQTLFRSADTLSQPTQQVSVRKRFDPPQSLRGRGLFIVGYAIDQAGHTGYALREGSTVAITADSAAKRDPTVYAFGFTAALPTGSLGADIAVDTVRSRVYVSNINKNQLEVFTYGSTLTAEVPVSVGAMPWGMTIDKSGSLLLVANSGGTNISKVDLLARQEVGRVKTTNEYLYDITYAKDEQSGGFKYTVTGPFDYSDRPQFIAQSASGALYYSTRPTSTATPGTLRRIDDFLDVRAEPRQIWQYGAVARGHWVVINADYVNVIKGEQGVPDRIVICDHPVGQTAASTCFDDELVPNVISSLRALGANADAILDLDIKSLALPDTNFVAVGGDRRRVVFGEANTGASAGRVLSVFDPSGTPAGSEVYNAPIEVADLTNNASDRVFGVAVNGNSTNIAVHGVETFFADSALRLQGKFATFQTGAGVAFHPRNVDENTADLSARVVFVASGDNSIQIVDSYSYRLRGRIPIRSNLYGPLRAVPPSPADVATQPTLVVKLFGLTREGLVVIDIHRDDIDNASRR